MTLSGASLLAALKATALPVVEKDAVMIVDSIMANIMSQCAAQPGDLVADLVGLALAALKPALDSEMAKLLPAAAPVA
jgi:hypothetical protein